MTTATEISFRADVTTVLGVPLVHLPQEASAALPSRGQVAVTGKRDGKRFSTVIEPDGLRGHWIRLDGAKPGTTVSFELAPADTWPEPVVPVDFSDALDDAPDLDDLWADITPMARWEWVRWIGATRNEATRAKRIDVGISKLRDGKRRPCCFDLSACTDPDVARSSKLAPDD